MIRQFRIPALIVVLALIPAMLIVSCNKKIEDDDDDISDFNYGDDEDDYFNNNPEDPDDPDDPFDPDRDCDGNAAPELISTVYVVNGDQFQTPQTVASGDEFAVMYEYNDDDCNLPSGQFFLSLDGADFENLGTIPDEIGCSTASSGLIYGVTLTEDSMAIGEHIVSSYWTDVCEAPSNQLDGSYTVAEE